MSPERPSRFRESKVHAWCLTVVNGLFHERNALFMSPEISLTILKYLAFFKVLHLLCVSMVSFKESKRTCLAPDCSQLCILHQKFKLCIIFDVSSFQWCSSSQECILHFKRKLCINSKVFSFPISLVS